MSLLTYNMKRSDQDSLFDSFISIRQKPSSNVNNLINSKFDNSNNPMDANNVPTEGLFINTSLKEDMDIFQLYNKAKQNLSHSNRILNLTWRLYKVKYKQYYCGKDRNRSSNLLYKIEDSFIFNHHNDIPEYIPSNHQESYNIDYSNELTNNNSNFSLNNNIHYNTDSNFFIDNDNFSVKDKEFDLFLEDPAPSIHESLMTPLPMDIPQSLPTHMFHHSSSFLQGQMPSSFTFNHMTPSSLEPTPSTSLTATMATPVFNDSAALRNEESISFSSSKVSDILKQKRSGTVVAPTIKRRSMTCITTATTTTTTNNNNNTGSSNSSSNVNVSSKSTRCSNCGTHNTPLWRKDPQGNFLCNACGLFLKLHGVMRPLSMKTDIIKKRQRTTNPNNSNNSKKNYNVKKVSSKDKINLDWSSLNL